MRFTFRLLGAIWISTLVVIASFAFFQIREERQWLTNDLERQAALLSEGLKDAVEPALAHSSSANIGRLLNKFARPDRGLAVYDKFANIIAKTPDLAPAPPPSLPEVTESIAEGVILAGFRSLKDRLLYVHVSPLLSGDRPVGALAIFLDASHLRRAEWERWRYNAIRFIVLTVVLSLTALFIIRMSITRPLQNMARWTRR